MTSSIHAIKTSQYPDGAVEFTIQTRGPVRRCVIHYGDGSPLEKLDLQKLVEGPTMISEHRFAPGVYEILVVIQADTHQVVDRRRTTWKQ